MRTGLIDDLVREAVAGGTGQLVLLGAGFDNRAYRLDASSVSSVPASAPASARASSALVAFEVDHPATQATKRRRVPPRFAARARFVPADLAVDDLRSSLLSAGFDPAAPAVVVWEGVTNYLTAESVDATLRGLAELLAPTSRVIFTYVDRAVLDDIATPADPAGSTFTGAAEWHEAVRRHGEPWTFGFDPLQLPSYVADRGLVLALDGSARDAAARYLAPLGRDEPTATFYRIAVADA